MDEGETLKPPNNLKFKSQKQGRYVYVLHDFSDLTIVVFSSWNKALEIINRILPDRTLNLQILGTARIQQTWIDPVLKQKIFKLTKYPLC